MKIIPKLVLSLIFVLGNFSSLCAGNFWYLSPGLCIGWNSSGNFTVDGKISIGINIDDKLDKLTFYNITLGFNAVSFKKAKDNESNEYNYIQFQIGTNPVKDNLIITGLGAGFIFNTNSKCDFSPIVRFFSGFLIFPEFDLIFINSNQFRSNFGIRGVLPIPMQKLDIGLN